MASIIGQLRREHVDLAALLDILEHEIDAIDEVGSGNIDVILGVLEYVRNYPELFHHPKEDALYRRLQHRAPKTIDAIGDLMKEHDDLGLLTEDVMEIFENHRADNGIGRARMVARSRDYLKVYREHIRIEEEFFLPAAERYLTAEDFEDVELSSPNPTDPLFPASEQELYRELRSEILHLRHGSMNC